MEIIKNNSSIIRNNGNNGGIISNNSYSSSGLGNKWKMLGLGYFKGNFRIVYRVLSRNILYKYRAYPYNF